MIGPRALSKAVNIDCIRKIRRVCGGQKKVAATWKSHQEFARFEACNKGEQDKKHELTVCTRDAESQTERVHDGSFA